MYREGDNVFESLNDLSDKLDALEAKIKEINEEARDRIKLLKELEHFNKRLIKALLKCEDVNNITLLPMGEFLGEKIS